jgi:hypothetical protein
MSGVKLLTRLDPQTCLKVAWRAAQDLSFSVPPIEECGKRFTARKGNALFNLIAGPLAPQCIFAISVEAYNDATEVVLEKNTPWLTSGAVGVAKVNKQADDLLAAITCGIETAGGSVHERKEF